MNSLADLPTPIEDRPAESNLRRRYEEVLRRAMRYAERIGPRDRAFEVAHEVSVEMLARAASEVSATLIFIRVTSKVRNLWRSGQRQAALDGAYVEMNAGATSGWGRPGADLEACELRERISAEVARMPKSMREVFLLVREQELTYKEAASRLRISVGTVHTQLSRANARLRECVAQYEADSKDAPRATEGPQP